MEMLEHTQYSVESYSEAFISLSQASSFCWSSLAFLMQALYSCIVLVFSSVYFASARVFCRSGEEPQAATSATAPTINSVLDMLATMNSQDLIDYSLLQD